MTVINKSFHHCAQLRSGSQLSTLLPKLGAVNFPLDLNLVRSPPWGDLMQMSDQPASAADLIDEQGLILHGLFRDCSRALKMNSLRALWLTF